MYLETVPVVVKKIYDELIAAKGIKLVPQNNQHIQSDLLKAGMVAQPPK